MTIKPIPALHSGLRDAPAQHGASLFKLGGNLMVPTTATGTLALTNGRLYLAPAYLPRPAEVGDVAVQVTVAGGAGALLRVGLYADNGNAAPEGAPLFDFGTIDIAGIGFRSASAPPFPILAPNVYWIATAAQGSPATPATLVSATGVILFAPTSWQLPSDSAFVGYRKTGDDVLGALPTLSPAPVLGLVDAPRCALLVGTV